MKTAYQMLSTIILILSATVWALDDNEEITPSEAGSQYWVYTVTWQPSFCLQNPKTAGCESPPEKFLTHGIWPYNNSTPEKNNRHPAFCNTAPGCEQGKECEISAGNLEQIAHEPEIAAWVTANPEGMFKHEWKKHGTCSGKAVQDYFNDIVRLRPAVQYDQAKFATWVGGSVMFDELKTAFPSNASYRCFVKDAKQYLHEVFYKITPNGAPYEDDAALQIGIACKVQETFIPKGK
ncbi:ribonuclease T2 family protein [Pseudomonas antarctica]|nr:ribonuclease [Pseudomonas antarctica]